MIKASKPILFCAIILSSILLGQSVFAVTRAAKSCSYDDVNAAVTESGTGDTVTIPAGKCDWGSSKLTINKAINLVGVDARLTNITGSGTSDIILVDTGAHDTFFPFTISGIQFTKIGGGSMLWVAGAGRGWRVHHNRFIGGDAIPNAFQAHAHGTTWTLFGLFDSNYIYWGLIGIGSSQSAPRNHSWQSVPQWGTDNAVFIENNFFDWTGALPHTCIDHNNGGRSVFRYNDVRECQIASHSTCGSSVAGGRSTEIYNNDFRAIEGSYTSTYAFLRAGSAVITRNVIAGKYSLSYPGKVKLDNRRSDGTNISNVNCNAGGIGFCDGTSHGVTPDDNIDDPSGYRCMYQPGAGTVVNGKFTSDPIHVWGNSADGVCLDGDRKWLSCTANPDCGSGNTCKMATALSPNSVTVIDSGSALAHIKSGRDYFDEDSGNNVKTDWTPYTCPHPLAGLSGSCDANVAGTAGYNVTVTDTIPPAAPSGLTVN